jgi:hypothetical protein
MLALWLMTALGHSRRFAGLPTASGLPPGNGHRQRAGVRRGDADTVASMPCRIAQAARAEWRNVIHFAVIKPKAKARDLRRFNNAAQYASPCALRATGASQQRLTIRTPST